MRKIVLLSFIILLFTQCQVLKEPAAKLLSVSLPPPTLDTLISENYPLADFNLMVSDLDGNKVKMEDYKGKVIFLNFWATWCLPCVAELPSINKMYNLLKNEKIVFLLISSEELVKVKRYHEKKEYNVPFMITDSTSVIPEMYRSPGIPTTFIINKKGQLVRASSGAEDWDDKLFIDELEKML